MLTKPENLALVEEIKSQLFPGELATLRLLGVTDQRICFAAHLVREIQAGKGEIRRGSIGRAYLAAEYSPAQVGKNTDDLMKNRGVQMLLARLLGRNFMMFTQIQDRAAQVCLEFLNSEDPKLRAIGLRYYDKIVRPAAQELQKTYERFEKMAETLGTQKVTEYSDEQIAAAIRELLQIARSRGIDPRQYEPSSEAAH
jgi:hypothetical protein